eukprot:Skav222394  [mRNA]  locus=scaffold4422:111252:111829:+ [translate_table: standard]
MAGNFNLQRILGNMPGMAGGGGQQQEDAALADTAEQVYISSLALLRLGTGVPPGWNQVSGSECTCERLMRNCLP